MSIGEDPREQDRGPLEDFAAALMQLVVTQRLALAVIGFGALIIVLIAVLRRPAATVDDMTVYYSDLPTRTSPYDHSPGLYRDPDLSQLDPADTPKPKPRPTPPQSELVAWSYKTGTSGLNDVQVDAAGNIMFYTLPATLTRLTSDGQLQWNYKVDAYRPEGSVVAADGRVFVLLERGVVCLSDSGQEQWDWDAAGKVGSVAVEARSGLCVVSVTHECDPGDPRYLDHLTDVSDFVALKKDGTVAWTYAAPSAATGPLACGSDGTVYASLSHLNRSDRGLLVALHGATGNEKWRLDAANNFGPIAFTTSGDILSTVMDYPNGLLRCISPQGKLRWESSVWLDDREPVWVSETGGIFAQGTRPGSSDGRNLYSFDSRSGAVLWKMALGEEIVTRPAFGTDGSVYMALSSGQLRAIDAQGNVKWIREAGSDHWGHPVMGADGNVYTVHGRDLLRISPEGKQLLEERIEGASSKLMAMPAGRIGIELVNGEFAALAIGG
jgi:outer membrane protein assembly factor BamB